MENQVTSHSKVLKPYPLDSVTIVGTGETGWELMTRTYVEGQFWKRRGGELWGLCNAGYSFRCDKIFSIHDAKHMEDYWREVESIWPENFKDLPDVPIVMAEQVEGVKNCLTFPLKEIVEEFQTDNFQCTTSYAMAFAMSCLKLGTGKRRKEIFLYGTDFTYKGLDEISSKYRHCVRYWIGRAAERGIQIHLPVSSPLNEMEGFYGYSKQPVFELGPTEEFLGR